MKTTTGLLLLCFLALSAMSAEIGVAVQTGTASWYGAESSKRTATGARYNPTAMTAAHRTLPIGTMIHVKNLKNGCSAVVCVTDRGPFCKGRILDVSKAAAEQLDMIHAGTAKVQIAVAK